MMYQPCPPDTEIKHLRFLSADTRAHLMSRGARTIAEVARTDWRDEGRAPVGYLMAWGFHHAKHAAYLGQHVDFLSKVLLPVNAGGVGKRGCVSLDKIQLRHAGTLFQLSFEEVESLTQLHEKIAEQTLRALWLGMQSGYLVFSAPPRKIEKRPLTLAEKRKVFLKIAGGQ